MNQTQQKMKTKNTKHEPNNVGSKTYQIWYKKGTYMLEIM